MTSLHNFQKNTKQTISALKKMFHSAITEKDYTNALKVAELEMKLYNMLYKAQYPLDIKDLRSGCLENWMERSKERHKSSPP